MATELKDLMDHAVAGLTLPPNLAQNTADRYTRGRRRRRTAVALLTVILVAAGGVIAWTVTSATQRSGISSITPLPPSPTAASSPPTASPRPTASSKIPPPLAPPATVTVVTAHEWFPNGRSSLDPPSAGQAPAEPTAAWNRLAATLPGNPCADAKPETVQFGLFTHGYPVPEPAYNKTPEWILRCIDNPAPPAVVPIPPGAPVPSNGPVREPTPTASATPQLEDFIWVFDARTGKLLLGWTESAS